MIDIEKEVEGALLETATGGIGIQTKLIAGLGVILLLILAALFIYHKGEVDGTEKERGVWNAKVVVFQNEKLALETKHSAEMAAAVQANQKKEKETSEKHQAEVDKLQTAVAVARRTAADRGGLRIPAPACTGAGGTDAHPETASTSGRDEASPGTVALPDYIQDSLWSIVNEADLVSAQLRACQGWIKSNGFYGNEDSEK